MFQDDFQIRWHLSDDFGEWGSRARKPLVQLDMAHKGELMDSVVGKHPATGLPIVYHVLRCEMCLLTHIFPLPTETEITAFYKREFYQNEKPEMITSYEEDAEWWAKCMHGPMLDVATKYSNTRTMVPRLLDVGAGPGLLLRQAQQRKWDTTAIEPSPLCAQRLRLAGHHVYEGTLTDYMHTRENTEASYDIITMYETLEHVVCPEETLLTLWDLLQPTGTLALCVPSEYTPAQFEACHRFSLPPWWLAPPQHISYFTPVTLKLLARRCGFKLRYIRMTFPLIERFMLKDNLCYVGNPQLGRQCHTVRMQEELHNIAAGQWPTLEAEYIANVDQRVGREMIAIFTKQ